MKLKYFKLSDFDCQVTGENKMDPIFLSRLDELREKCGFPFIINSGYRSPKHHIEARKNAPGVHSIGVAADIRVNNGFQRAVIIREAVRLGFTGIGVAKGFVHVDIRTSGISAWSY